MLRRSRQSSVRQHPIANAQHNSRRNIFGHAVEHKTDAATGEHGDLLDLIGLSMGFDRLHDVLERGWASPHVCRRIVSNLPRRPPSLRRQPPASVGSPESARRPVRDGATNSGTIGEAYLRNRGITALHEAAALRFHPRCYYRPDVDAPTEIWPALIAAVTDLTGKITGVHRTWLDPWATTRLPSTRRGARWVSFSAMEPASAWRPMSWRPAKVSRPCSRCEAFCRTCPCSPRSRPITSRPILFPATLRRLYVARDDDPAGNLAVTTLTNGPSQPGSRRSRCRPRWAISTTTSVDLASTNSARPCVFSSPRKMCPDSVSR